jgi:hypothetical protein
MTDQKEVQMVERATPAREGDALLADVVPFPRGARWEDVDLSLQTGVGETPVRPSRRRVLTLVRDLEPARRNLRYLRP